VVGPGVLGILKTPLGSLGIEKFLGFSVVDW